MIPAPFITVDHRIEDYWLAIMGCILYNNLSWQDPRRLGGEGDSKEPLFIQTNEEEEKKKKRKEKIKQ